MIKHLFSLFFLTVLFIVSGMTASGQEIVSGEETYKQTCAACHSIGMGRLVGPDLANVTQRRPQDWITKFIKSSQSVIKSGDKYADSLFQAFNKLVMPDQPTLSDDQIKNVISYIEVKSTAPATTGPDTAAEQTGQNKGKSTGTLFSTTNILLFGVILLMLIVILFLARINKNLLDQIRDFYSSDRAFFK